MIILGLLLVGLCFGSFINALVWRIHEQDKMKAKKQKQKTKQQTGQSLKSQLRDLSIVRGRSMCVHCKHTLAARDLIPIFSWLSLGGKCRYCQMPIDDTPLVELFTCASFIFSYIFWPLALSGQGLALFVLWLIILTGLIALLVYDIRWMLLPNRIIISLAGIVVLQTLLRATIFGGGLETIVKALWGVLLLGGLFYCLFQVSKGRWIGGGDVKLGFVLGMLVGGPLPAMLLLFIASFLGTIVSLPLLVSKKLQTSSRIPFGPFLIVATILIYLFGARWILQLQSQLVIGA